MPVYIWEYRNKSGMKIKDEIEAKDEKTALMLLRRRNITPTKIREKPKDLFENIAFFQPKVTTKDVVIFTRQLSTMIDAGLPLVQCLDILSSQQENPTFKKILREVKNEVESGLTLAEALRKYPKQFDKLYCNMVAAGEMGGILDDVLRRLATYLEKAEVLKAKIKSALNYPVIVLAISAAVIGIIMVFVIPVFAKMFEGSGQALPAPTLAVMAMSNFVKSYFFAIIAGIVIIITAFKKYYQTDKGKLVIDRLALMAPVFGPLIRKVAVAKFARTLGTLINSGVPIIEALNVAAGTAGNKVVENAIKDVKMSISEGRTIAQPLQESGIFPGMVVQMISVGETTGALDAMLGKIADFYDEEVDAAVEGLTSMIEPLMITFLGGFIGGIIVAMYLPIFKMAGAIAG